MKHTHILLLSLLLITGSWSCKNKQTVKPERKDITQAVYASGKALPINHYLVIARLPGYVDRIHVNSGDTVRIGDPLITLRNESNEYSISSAGNAAALARSNADENGPTLTALREEMQAARSKYDLDSINFMRNSSLLKEEAISKIIFDQSKTQLDLSRSAYAKSQANFRFASDRARTEYLNAVNLSRSQQSNRQDYILTSAIDGKVYDVVPKTGDLVNAQSVLIEMGDAERFEVEMSIDETDIGLVRKGQTVIFGIDAYPDQPFKGEVVEIIPKVTSNSKSSRVKATIDSNPETPLFCNMSVEGNIIIGTKKNCLVIPRDYLHNGNEVYVEGEEKPRLVKKGIEDLQFVEVTAGLTGEENLIK